MRPVAAQPHHPLAAMMLLRRLVKNRVKLRHGRTHGPAAMHVCDLCACAQIQPQNDLPAPVISPRTVRMAVTTGLAGEREAAYQLFFPATAALRTVANAVHAISGTARAAAV